MYVYGEWEGHANWELNSFFTLLFCLDNYVYIGFDIPLFRQVSTSTSPNTGIKNLNIDKYHELKSMEDRRTKTQAAKQNGTRWTGVRSPAVKP